MLERNDRTEGYPKQDAIVGCSWSLVALASGSPDEMLSTSTITTAVASAIVPPLSGR
jgi:hypothetical protein